MWREGVARGLVSPPVVTGPVVLTATTSRTVVALSAGTGSRYWEDEKSGPFLGPPLLDGDRLYAAADIEDGEVHAMRLRDGEDRWNARVGPVSVPLLLDDGTVYAISGRPPHNPARLHALDAEDGSTVWAVELPHGPASGPLSASGRILVPTHRDSLYAVDRGRIVGRTSLGGEVSAPPAVVGDTVYAPLFSGEVAVVTASGLEALGRLRTSAPVLAAPVATADGRLYVLDRSGVVWSGLRSEGRLRRLADLEGTARASLAVAEEILLVGLLDGRFVAVDRGTGEVVWSVRFDDSVHAPAAVRDGRIYVPLLRGTVVSLR